jgi:hypothetical protein
MRTAITGSRPTGRRPVDFGVKKWDFVIRFRYYRNPADRVETTVCNGAGLSTSCSFYVSFLSGNSMRKGLSNSVYSTTL